MICEESKKITASLIIIEERVEKLANPSVWKQNKWFLKKKTENNEWLSG